MRTAVRKALGLAAVLSLVAACANEPSPFVPALVPAPPAPSWTAPPSASTAPSTSAGDPEACLSEASRAEVRACPPGPPVDYVALMQMQRALPPENLNNIHDMRPRPISPDRARFVEAARRFVCSEKESDERAEARYMIGRAYFEVRRFDEAALYFYDAALRKDESAIFAAQLSLECLHVLERERPPCGAVLREWAVAWDKAFCAGKQPADREQACRIFARVAAAR